MTTVQLEIREYAGETVVAEWWSDLPASDAAWKGYVNEPYRGVGGVAWLNAAGRRRFPPSFWGLAAELLTPGRLGGGARPKLLRLARAPRLRVLLTWRRRTPDASGPIFRDVCRDEECRTEEDEK